jgi:hypothetical protein
VASARQQRAWSLPGSLGALTSRPTSYSNSSQKREDTRTTSTAPNHEADASASNTPGKSHSDESLRNDISHDDVMRCIKSRILELCMYDAVAESPLFKFPCEIRDMIYRLSLITQTNRSSRRDAVSINDGGMPEPALLSDSKLSRFNT